MSKMIDKQRLLEWLGRFDPAYVKIIVEEIESGRFDIEEESQ